MKKTEEEKYLSELANLKATLQGLDTLLSEKTQECYRLQKELDKRPFEIKASAEIMYPSHHPKLTKALIAKFKNKERFFAQVLIEGEKLWCIAIGIIDSYDDGEEGEIFAGILDDAPKNNKLKYNDLIQFQSCDVIDIKLI